MITQEMIDEHKAVVTERLSRGPQGKWNSEPVRIEFKHAGLDCLMVRQENHGAWCGYVGVPPTHPYFGKEDYNEDGISGLDVHGGITYSNKCDNLVCHFSDNEDEKRWWFGFDCMHVGDVAPLMSFSFGHGAIYRDQEYVIGQTEKLAEQLAKRAA